MGASIINLRRRIRSVKNTLKTTAAMQMISSVKMRRATGAAADSRGFVAEARRLLARITASGGADHPLLKPRSVKRGLVVVVAADKGLAGSYNSDVLKQALTIITDWQARAIGVTVVTVGRRAAAALRVVRDVELLATFDNLPEGLDFTASAPISQLVMKEYQAGRCDQVKVVYQHYVSTIVQQVKTLTLIPLAIDDTDDSVNQLPDAKAELSDDRYTFEPDEEGVLAAIVPYLIHSNLWQLLLESRAAEHAARMVAMKNATDSGKELVGDLTFTANQVRQAAITAEIAEIAAGAAAIAP